MARKYFLIFIAGLLTLHITRSAASVKYNMLTNRDGMSNSSVNCIYQDSMLMIWIGTWDGLNVYNGRGFKTYKFAPDDPNTISNNVIWNIVEESKGIIWIATDDGINRIDVNEGRIERFHPGYEENSPSVGGMFSVCASKEGIIFCGATGWGISYYEKSLGRLSALNIQRFNTLDIKDMYDAGNNTLLLHTIHGELAQVSYEVNEAGGVEIREKTELLGRGRVESIFNDKATLHIITSDNLIYLYNKNIRGGEFLPAFLPSQGDEVRAVARYDGGKLVMAFASSGVYVYDPTGEGFSRMSELDDINVMSLYYGSQEILWVGTDGQGVIQLYDDETVFNKVPNNRMFASRSAPVRAFYRDEDGDLYIGTKGNGICVMEAGGAIRAKYDNSSGLTNSFVFALQPGYDNDIFVGHDGTGLDVLKPSTGTVTNIKPFVGKRFGSVYSIYRDDANNRLWLGTNGYGLVCLHLEKSDGAYRIRRQDMYANDKDDDSSLSNNTVFSIVPAPGNKLWVGTRGGGLNLFDITTGTSASFTTATLPHPISSNDILSLYTGRDSTLWIGTSYGLNMLYYDEKGDCCFRKYEEKDGLPNNTIHGILEDDSGNLWLSTNKGLSKLDPRDGTVISYYSTGELQSNEFSDGAYYRSPDGRMYFGGVDGFNYFNPEDIRVRIYKPEVLINNFYIKQEPVAGFRPDGEIVLGADENFFSINFSALEYIGNNNCEYAYILKGFNDDWVYTGTDNTAVFTNVPPGTYEFLVRGTNGDKIWSDKVTSFYIRVRPPWWNTWWAYLMYAVIAAAVGYVIWMVISDRIEHKRQLLMESLDRKQQSDNYEAKLNFFTGIAHEFCSPLTLIYGSGEQLLDKYTLPPDVARHIRTVKNNADRMHRLIGELMEFRKVDSGNYTPRYGTVDLSALVSTIVDYFNEENELHRIDLNIEIRKNVTVTSDQGALEKILYNLISNAYKYTPEDGKINIELNRKDSTTTFRITNSGKGIKPEEIGSVFNRFEILDNFERRANEGKVMRNGIGLALARSLAKVLGGDISVESKPGHYTTFTVLLPEISAEHISEPVDDRSGILPPTRIAERESRPAPKGKNGGGPLILVVDDEEQIRDLITEILSGEYTVIQAADGLEAIEILRHERPDLVISDINMPNLDGMELLEYLKTNDITKHIPLVFLTFKTDIENEIKGYELGSEAYISKPFYPKHLLAVVHQILNNRSSLKDFYNSVLSTSDLYEGNVIDADDKKFIVQLTGIIEENMSDENLSLSFICEKMFVSRMQLHRKIKEITRMTPSEYIRSVKINHAAHLLKTTNMTVQEIMYISGFNNKSYFYREFAKIYRMSPKEMREKER